MRNFHSDDSFVGMDGHDYLADEDWKERQHQVYFRDGGACKECGARDWITDVHHIIHRGQGGSDDLDNLILLCRPCHDKKHADRRPQWTPKT